MPMLKTQTLLPETARNWPWTVEVGLVVTRELPSPRLPQLGRDTPAVDAYLKEKPLKNETLRYGVALNSWTMSTNATTFS
jgi:hypothetical protein